MNLMAYEEKLPEMKHWEKRDGEMLFGTTASILTCVTGVLDKRGTKTLTWKSACPKAQWDRDWDGTESIHQLEMTAETTDFPGHQPAGSSFTYVFLCFSQQYVVTFVVEVLHIFDHFS